MGFFPTGPLTSLYALILLISCMVVAQSDDRDFRRMALILFAGWIAARTATAFYDVGYQSIWVYALASAVLSWLCFRQSSRIYSVIGVLFAVKVLGCYLPYLLGFLNVEQMWAFSEIPAYLSIAIMIGGAAQGGKRIKSLLSLKA